MRRVAALCFVLVFLAVGASTVSSHQHPRGHHIHHHGALPAYDVSTEETLEGTVEELFRWERSGCVGCDDGVQVFLGGHDIEVHLCPFAYLESEGCHIKEGDEVRITGSRLSLRGNTLLLARELHCGDHHVALRDEKGSPLWRDRR